MANEAHNKDIGVNVVLSNDSREHNGRYVHGGSVEEGDFVTRAEERDLARGLHQRHISLIAIAGAIVSILCAVVTA